MPTFNPVVRHPRKDGLYQVYVRIIHKGKPAYLKTDKVVAKNQVGKGGDIRDVFVKRFCLELAERFICRLNQLDISGWSATDIRDYLVKLGKDYSFSDFCDEYIGRLASHGEGFNAKVYRAALNSYKRYTGAERISFKGISKRSIIGWIDSLRGTKRAKTLYPICLRMMYRAALEASTDAMSGIEGMPSNMWAGVEIPMQDVAEKRAITIEECREFFNCQVPEGVRWAFRGQLGKDVALMTMCLAGINTVDLFKLKKSDFHDGILHYKRSKTSGRRRDGAYFEMRVPDILEEAFARCVSVGDSENLFWFADRYGDSKVFNITVNEGIKRLCESLGNSHKRYSVYTFRHTWATVAQNHCGASIPEIGFAMNHTQGHGVTRGYIKLDFTPAWTLNERVVDFVFHQGKACELGHEDCSGDAGVMENAMEEDRIGLTPKAMVYARAYFRGEVLAEVCDIGFRMVDEIIARLVKKMPDEIPDRCAVQFRVRNIDADREAVYEREKGKGF